MYIFASKIKKKSWLHLLLLRAVVIGVRLQRIRGLRSVEARVAGGAFWVKEAWTDRAAMVAYRKSAKHREHFQKMQKQFAGIEHVQFEASVAPSWDDVAAMMAKKEGGGNA